VFIKRLFNIQAVIAEAVEVEIRKSRKFNQQFTKPLQKAIDAEALVVIEPRTLPAFVAIDAYAVYSSIQTLGARYSHSGLDYGEAYTYATALVLDAPVVSNDRNAIATAQRRNLQMPTLVARFYDIVVLCRQTEQITNDDCNEIRKRLAAKSEFIPTTFRNRSFEDGLPGFYARLIDGSIASIGAVNPLDVGDVRIVLNRV
jgi:predicted nucleic acid-binding protein